MIAHRRRSTSPLRTAPRGQRGETLIELMATVMLLGVAVVALITSLMNLMQLSAGVRANTRASNETVNIAEVLRGVNYTSCATSASYTSAMPTMPPGYTAKIEKVEWLDTPTAASSTSSSAARWRDSTGACGTDLGAQRITVSVTASKPTKQRRSLTFVKRNRTCLTDPTGPQVC